MVLFDRWAALAYSCGRDLNRAAAPKEMIDLCTAYRHVISLCRRRHQRGTALTRVVALCPAASTPSRTTCAGAARMPFAAFRRLSLSFRRPSISMHIMHNIIDTFGRHDSLFGCAAPQRKDSGLSIVAPQRRVPASMIISLHVHRRSERLTPFACVALHPKTQAFRPTLSSRCVCGVAAKDSRPSPVAPQRKRLTPFACGAAATGSSRQWTASRCCSSSSRQPSRW